MYLFKTDSLRLYYFDMSKRPDRLELIPYQNHLEEAAKNFGVSQRTIRRWLTEVGLYNPRKGWGRGKLARTQVQKIRDLYRQEKQTQAEMAEMFDVSQAMICRIVNNLSHRTTVRLGGEASYRIVEEEDDG
mgnify:CR=1 FL=1